MNVYTSIQYIQESIHILYAALREKEASPRMAAVTKRLREGWREGWRGVKEGPSPAPEG